MALQPVAQVSYTGCFIACVAMVLKTDYRGAFGLLHPGKDMDLMYSHGFSDVDMEGVAHKLLRGLGFKTHTGKYRQFKSYKERVKKNTIMIIRWKYSPTMCHCVLFDHEAKRFIDPSGGYIVDSEYELRNLQRQLAYPIVIDKIPNLEIKRDFYRDVDPLGLAW